MSDKNQLYFGDNLDVLRRYVADESVDLVYLDPPFNSNANYNVLFKEHDGADAAQIGVFISMHPPTKPMRTEAVGAGFYESPWGKHAKIQLVTVGELLKGARIDMPSAQGMNVTFKKAPKPSRKGAETMELPLQGDGE